MLVWMPALAQPRADLGLASVLLEHHRHHVAGGARATSLVLERHDDPLDASPAARGSARVSSRRRVDFLLQAPQAREQQRRARLVEAVVEAERRRRRRCRCARCGGPMCRSSSRASGASARTRRRRRRRCTSSPPSPTERTLLEKKLNAPARPQVPSLRPSQRRARRVRDVLDQRDARARRRAPSAVDRRPRSRAKCTTHTAFVRGVMRPLDVLRVEARASRARRSRRTPAWRRSRAPRRPSPRT